SHADTERALGPRDAVDLRVAHLDVRIGAELLARDPAEVVGRDSIAGDEVVDPDRRGVAPGTGVADQHALARAAQRQRCGEPGGASTHDEDVVGHVASPRGVSASVWLIGAGVLRWGAVGMSAHWP